MNASELKTSSGRMVWLTNICMVISAVMGFLPAVLVAKVVALLVIVYTLYRTVAPALESLAKMTKTTKDDEALAELAQAIKILTDKFGTPKQVAVTIEQPVVKVE